MKIALLFAALLMITEPTLGLDVDEIYKFEPCYGYRDDHGRAPMLSSKLADELKSPENFPSWGISLGPYINAIDRMKNEAALCSANPERLNLPFHPLMKSVSLVAVNTAKLIQNDLDQQQADLKKISNCLKESNASSAKARDERCEKILNYLVGDLRQRMSLLRNYMALNSGVDMVNNPDHELKHDLPYTLFISKFIFPNQKHWNKTLSPLTNEERQNLPEFSRQIPRDRSPAELYDQMLSTTPILLLLDENVTRDSLQRAVRTLEENYPKRSDTIDFRQELFLQTPYVARAISSLPLGEQENACLATKAVYMNLKKQYETLPRSLAGIALAASLPTGAAAAAGGKSLLSEFLSRSVWAAGGFTAFQVTQLSKRYWDGITYCSMIYREKNTSPDADGLCSLGKSLELQSDAEAMTAINVGVLGVMKAAPVYKMIYKKSK